MEKVGRRFDEKRKKRAREIKRYVQSTEYVVRRSEEKGMQVIIRTGSGHGGLTMESYGRFPVSAQIL